MDPGQADEAAEKYRGIVDRLDQLHEGFYEDDESVDEVRAVQEAADGSRPEPPTGGVGWCAPSP